MSIIAVHGFGFDPATPADSPNALYASWSAMLGQPVDAFAWFSASPADEVRALSHGYPDAYAWAYRELAPTAAARLISKIQVARGPIDIICHSLGSRVALNAIDQLPSGYVRRVLILDGAETQTEAPASLPAGVEVLNCVVRTDLVLKNLGAVFNDEHIAPCVGQAGLGRIMDRWADLVLDDPQTAARVKAARGWALGASPRHQLLTGNLIEDLRNLGNHWSAYSRASNEPLYRAWFAGDSLADLLT